ncbi:hypothetical protein PVBG_05488 [Plasmodium vivax Brazil I]|uniref:Variable surface protein n=1 Tax=Plasmodium vivax (strain Brazil I) TaxID=1033975 RepID=A0A0J9ST60_PLAV1|nr:hypothetical protein PVBG_05488 [Plasmodium vivax Brazil I]
MELTKADTTHGQLNIDPSIAEKHEKSSIFISISLSFSGVVSLCTILYNYNFTRLFYNTKSIFHDFSTYHDQKYEQGCDQFISQNSVVGNSFKSQCIKCMTYIKYLEHANFYSPSGSLLNVAQSLLYLYFWIDDNELSTTNYNKINIDIYQKLLESFDTLEYTNMQSTYNLYIKDNIIEKLKLIYNLYYKFDKIKHYEKCKNTNCKCVEDCVNLYTKVMDDCNNDVNADYCNELEKFRQIYHAQMKNYNTCDVKYKYLPSPIKSNIAVISVSVVITLITLILFLYKVCNIFMLIYVYYTCSYNIINIKI